MGDSCPAATLEFLQALFEPDDLVELRHILPQRRGSTSGFHRGPAQVAAAWQAVEHHNRTKDCYFGACPRAVEGKEDCHVQACRAVFVDFDDCETSEARSRLTHAGLPHPTAIVWSGHGVHCYWRLTEPISPATFAAVQKGLAALVGSDPVVHNPSRIMRLPGTMHVAKGNAECYLEEIAGGAVPLADIEAALPKAAPAPPVSRAPVAGSNGTAPHRTFTAGGRNVALTREAGRLRRLGLDGDEIKAALQAMNRKRCRPPLDEREVSGIGDSVAKYESDGEVGAEPVPPEPYRPFPVQVLPEPLAAYVRSAAEAIGCDPAYIALPLLAGLASAVGSTHRIILKRRWQEPAIIWAAIVGDSGTAKSPALEVALRPVRERQHHAMLAHRLEAERHGIEMEMHEKRKRAWRNDKSDDPPPEEPGAPTAPRCWSDDCTIEALEKLLEENPRGILVIRDELAGWISSFDRYASARGGDVARWLEIFGGRSIVVDRRSSGNVYVPHAVVSIVGGIQPGTLRRVLGQEHFENGLAARLLLAMPPRTARQWTEADVDPHTEADVEGLFDALYRLEPVIDEDGDQRPRLVALTPEAREVWIEFFNRHGLEQVELDGPLAAAWSKLEGYAARFALIIHMVRQYTSGGNYSACIDAATIRAGVALSEWFGAEARRIYAVISQTEAEQRQGRVYEWLQRQGGSATRRDVAKALFKGDTEAAQRALDELAEGGCGGWEQQQPGPRGGRPSARFRTLDDTPKPKTPAGGPTGGGFGFGDSGTTAKPTSGEWIDDAR